MLKAELSCPCGATIRLEVPEDQPWTFSGALNKWLLEHQSCAARPMEPVKTPDSACRHLTAYSDTGGTHCANCGALLTPAWTTNAGEG